MQEVDEQFSIAYLVSQSLRTAHVQVKGDRRSYERREISAAL
jgi:hypothetical protein